MGLGFEHRSSCCHLFCVYFLTLRSHSFVSLAVVVKRTFPSSLLLHWGIDVKGFPEQVGWLISNYKDSKMVRIFHPCSLVHPPTHTHTRTHAHTHTHPALEIVLTTPLSCHQGDTSNVFGASPTSVGCTCVHQETAFG